MDAGKGTTKPGYENRNYQVVLHKMNLLVLGPDPYRCVYALRERIRSLQLRHLVTQAH